MEYNFLVHGVNAGAASPTVHYTAHLGSEFEINSPNITGFTPSIDTVTNEDLPQVELPDEITVYLLADGEVIETVTLNADNDWTETIEDLPEYRKGENGKPVRIKYSWTEAPIENFTLVNTTVNENETIFTNKPNDVAIVVNYTPIIYNDEPETPLGLGQVFINVGDCLE